ncbi:hypothetical protein G6F56_003311 [Rhizopus delemar]|nr:hypothetical protein G6F56_003311 [Rhizopus delemar]
METLAERRKLSTNPEKLKLNISEPIKQSNQTLQRLEEENAKLPPQDSEEYLLSRLERQNILLNADPKSVCIESNRLQADFNTIRRLVTDATFSPTHENHEASIQAILAKSPLIEINKEDEWDFWQAIVEDYTAAATKLPHLLAAKLRYGGIPHKIRGVIWQSMAQSSSLNLESLYGQLSKETSSYERIIQRDLSRTFPQLDMFKADGGEGQLALGRLLKAYSIYDLHVGYCQGLAFLAGPLLMTMPEDQAFCTFVRLMETYEMRTMFTLNMEGLHLRLHQFEALLTQYCPRLAAHLESHSIHTAMYASQWYLTLFAYTFPISLVLRIYDLVFAEGAVETITRVAIAIMQKNEENLLKLQEFETLMIYLSSRNLYQTAYSSDPEAVIQDAMALSTVITRQKMSNISDQYHAKIEQEKKQLAMRSLSKRESWFNWGAAPKSADWVEPETPWAEEIGQRRVLEEAREQQPSPAESSGSDQDTLDEVTSELVAVKLANFEMGLKYQTLCQDHEGTCKKLQDLQTGQASLIEKLMELQTALKMVRGENEELLAEQERWLEEKEGLEEKSAVAKRTLADLQMEKMSLDRDCQGYQERIKELEDQRNEYLMPRGSFTEEVFAAHKTLFAQPTLTRRQTDPDMYQEKFIQSDLRCRELEKLLAEAKFKIVECEANHTLDKPTRNSLQARRPTSLQVKRGSLSALMGKNGPTSPSFIEPARESTDSLRSATSTASQKRSSVYSRFVNALSSGPLSEQITE